MRKDINCHLVPKSMAVPAQKIHWARRGWSSTSAVGNLLATNLPCLLPLHNPSTRSSSWSNSLPWKPLFAPTITRSPRLARVEGFGIHANFFQVFPACTFACSHQIRFFQVFHFHVHLHFQVFQFFPRVWNTCSLLSSHQILKYTFVCSHPPHHGIIWFPFKEKKKSRDLLVH